MPSDKAHNSCAAPEKPPTPLEEEDLIHNIYTAGSIVWGRLDGYPWWPAMVDDDPDTEQYYWLNSFSDIPVSNILHSNILHSNVLHSNILHSNVLHSNILHSNVLHSNILHSNVLHSEVLHSNILHSNPSVHKQSLYVSLLLSDAQINI